MAITRRKILQKQSDITRVLQALTVQQKFLFVPNSILQDDVRPYVGCVIICVLRLHSTHFVALRNESAVSLLRYRVNLACKCEVNRDV